jgi:hypothetical protein
MPNIESPGLTDEQRVACAILCCDRKHYVMKKRNRKDKECQRLGSKKHSCVLHQLREKKDGRLTQQPRFPGINANPACSAPGIGRVLRPDIMIGSRVIDAKFPCDPAKIREKNKGLAFGDKAQYPSEKSGRDMTTGKEAVDYKNIDKPTKVSSTKTMTPEQAAKKVPGGCECTKMQ